MTDGCSRSRRRRRQEHERDLSDLLVLPAAERIVGLAVAKVAKQTRRGWRLHRPGHEPIDAAIAPAIALDRAQHVEPPVQLLGWL